MTNYQICRFLIDGKETLGVIDPYMYPSPIGLIKVLGTEVLCLYNVSSWKVVAVIPATSTMEVIRKLDYLTSVYCQ